MAPLVSGITDKAFWQANDRVREVVIEEDPAMAYMGHGLADGESL